MKSPMKTGVMMILASVASLAFVASPALAKDKDTKKKSATTPYTTAAAAASSTSHVPDAAQASKTGSHDTTPGPAWKTVGGTVKQIEGNAYTVEDYDGNQVRLYVGQGTKQLRGAKKVGDTVRAEITRGGFANSVQ